MLTILAVIHIIACVVLVVLVLIQDSKGGGVFGASTTSSSFLGATGATTLANRMTKVIGITLAVTCIGIAYVTAQGKKSVVETGMMNSLLPTATQPATGAAGAAGTSNTTNTAASTTETKAPEQKPEEIKK